MPTGLCKKFRRALWFALALAALSGCGMVKTKTLSAREYIARERGDVLSSGEISEATGELLRTTGLDQSECAQLSRACIGALSRRIDAPDERRLAAAAELWLKEALAREKTSDEAALEAWFEVARNAYAYLFFSARPLDQRALEARQIQVGDYYDYAAQKIVTGLYRKRLGAGGAGIRDAFAAAGWNIRMDMSRVRFPEGVSLPKELIPAGSLAFSGLRSSYRRDGLGTELVAVMNDDPVAAAAPPRAGEFVDGRADANRPVYSEMPSPALTLLVHFAGDDLAQVLATRDVRIAAYDPYRDASVGIHGQRVPLSADFTAGYALWLSRAHFSHQAIKTLLGRKQGIDRPHIYMMQPYDPDRRVLLMLHGLASSPEAWVNVVNEIAGDRELREQFQVWQVYYPTNAPIAYNQAIIRDAVVRTLGHFDPGGDSRASRDMVLIGHSMGGVLARLLVSSSGDTLWNEVRQEYAVDAERAEAMRARLDPLLRFEPLPQAERVIFIAAPHRGTRVAGKGLVQWLAGLVKLPGTLIAGFGDIMQELAQGKREDGSRRAIPNSVDNLSQTNPFVRAAADLPISPKVRYHSIVARRDPKVALEASDDGLVPYASSHLPGAASELAITSGHSVQETAAAISEVRRILHEDIDAVRSGAR
ncbi:esterase/lipase family protein [Lysobacter enzymogenes]|uniref:esterase/lipase family protein n=1 Tax=Lysobacter enzymogenes TaxID=69 RepID=UPI00099CE820|nr:alpha/beta hydrolase [Lysobacter enzymogenes]UZW62183.1 alpha/beta hydrolase [Lysobacter enzymogenes]